MRIKVTGNQFDLKFTVKHQDKEIELMGIDKKELIPLQDYFKEKGVNLIGDQQR